MDATYVSRETLPADLRERLDGFAALLARWNARINLIGRHELAQLWPRHILDSLRLAPLIPPGTPRAIDLGSGAGFPGLVLALATGIPFTLVESDLRKAAFLQDAIAATGAPATVRAARIEAAELAPAPLVTARALAPLGDLIGLAFPLLVPGGVCLFPKGKSAPDELTSAERLWQFSAEVIASPGDTGEASSPILKLSEIAHVRHIG